MLTKLTHSSYWRILQNCFLTVVLIYGSLHVLFEMIFRIIPIAMIVVGLLSFLLYLVRLPPPDKSLVDAVIRRDIRETSDIETNNMLKTVAHRGAGLDAPENSIESFQMCFARGCYTVEFDVALTSDDVPVVFHDETLERMTDLALVVSNTEWAKLKNIDISIKHPFKNKFKDVRIPTLNQVVEYLLSCKEMHMLINLKDNNRKVIQIILDLFEKHQELNSRAVVTTFYANLIYYIRRSNPKIVCGLVWRPRYYSTLSYSLQTGVIEKRTKNIFKYMWLVICDNIHEWFLSRLTYSILGISLILLHKDTININMVEEWRAKGVRVIAWSVNQPVEKQYFTRTVKVTYMTDTLTGESSVHSM